MIIARIFGGLGNQLFQYATGFALARKFGVPLKVHVSDDTADRPFLLRQLGLPCTLAEEEEWRELAPRWGSAIKNKAILWSHRMTPFSRRTWVREESFDFDPRLFSLRPPVYLDGYWQSFRYFADCSSELRGLINAGAECTCRPYSNCLDGKEVVAVHVRRGDYVHNPAASQFHGTCDLDYYRSAFAWMGTQMPDASYLLFSDDRQWAAQHVVPLAKKWVGSLDTEVSAIDDFREMTRCQHFIIANSSFSWWAAWLAERPQHHVAAPRHWFAGNTIEEQDRFPANWHLI